MAPPTVQTLQRLAAETGYRLDTLEKVLRLLELLDEIAQDPVLSQRLALKGGTALDVFYLDLDRLSVDIDLNYVGALDLAAMERERLEVSVRYQLDGRSQPRSRSSASAWPAHEPMRSSRRARTSASRTSADSRISADSLRRAMSPPGVVGGLPAGRPEHSVGWSASAAPTSRALDPSMRRLRIR